MTTMTLFKRVLVPHDFSAAASKALIVAAQLAAEHGGRVTVLHVLTPLYSGPGYPTQAEIAWSDPEEIVADRRTRLERLVHERVKSGARKVVCKVVAGEAVPSILHAAKSATVIVMSTLGRTGLTHLLIGSVAEKVVRHSPVPVLTIHGATRPRRKERSRARRGR